MINPNQTKSVFWLIIILAVVAVAGVLGYNYYKKHHVAVEDADAVVVDDSAAENAE